MNIFVLDLNPKKCAELHCDKHVIKMIVETAQLLCTAHHINGTTLDGLYKLTHKNHPCAIWVRESYHNYVWTVKLGLELCFEYYKRYSKIHKTQELLEKLSITLPDKFPRYELTKRPLCMPEKYHTVCVVESYISYYKNDKKDILKYKNGIPEQFKNL
jgi:hypothetical protein